VSNRVHIRIFRVPETVNPDNTSPDHMGTETSTRSRLSLGQRSRQTLARLMPYTTREAVARYVEIREKARVRVCGTWCLYGAHDVFPGLRTLEVFFEAL